VAYDILADISEEN